jgi:hypothetical protein
VLSNHVSFSQLHWNSLFKKLKQEVCCLFPLGSLVQEVEEVCCGGVQGVGLSPDIDYWTVLLAIYLFSSCPSGRRASLHRRNAHFEYVH